MTLITPEEKAQILQLVLKDVRVSKDLLTLNMYDFSSLTISDVGLENRTEWLPCVASSRTLCPAPTPEMKAEFDRLQQVDDLFIQVIRRHELHRQVGNNGPTPFGLAFTGKRAAATKATSGIRWFSPI